MLEFKKDNRGNLIHSTVVIEGDVYLGSNNIIKPYSYLIGPLKIGDDNIIGPFVTIGSPGGDTRTPRYDSTNCKIQIGNRNIIREYTSVQKPLYRDITLIEDDVHIMQGVHFAHDVIARNQVVISSLASIGGLAVLMEGANIAMNASVHQHSIVGPYSIVGTAAGAVKNIRPFSRYIPGQPITTNEYAVKKFGFLDQLDEVKAYVEKSVWPQSEKLKKIVESYVQLHEKSGRRQYENKI